MAGLPMPSYSSALSSLPRLSGDGMENNSLRTNVPVLLGSSPPSLPLTRHRSLNSSNKAATIAKTQKPKHVPKEPTKGAVGFVSMRTSKEFNKVLIGAAPIEINSTSLNLVRNQEKVDHCKETSNNTSHKLQQINSHHNYESDEKFSHSGSSYTTFLTKSKTVSPVTINVFEQSLKEEQPIMIKSQSTNGLKHSELNAVSEQKHFETENILSSNSNKITFSVGQGCKPLSLVYKPIEMNSDIHMDNASHTCNEKLATPKPLMKMKVDMPLSENSCGDLTKCNNTRGAQLMISDGSDSSVTVAPPVDEREVEGQSKPDEDVTKLQSQLSALKMDLDQQVKVNMDLKKLLVASVGDDLHWKMDALVQTKTQLASEIGGYNERMRKDYEELDSLSIQADMWRSKFMASRVLVDQLSSAKEKLVVKNAEAERALKHLLQEHQQLHDSMMETHRYLKFLRDSFDPVFAQKTESIIPNILELARTNLLLAEAIKFKLVGSLPMLAVALDAGIQNGLSPAEKMAYEVLLSDMCPTRQGGVPRCLSSQLLSHYGRFNPSVRVEAISWNCCRNCRGDVHVV